MQKPLRWVKQKVLSKSISDHRYEEILGAVIVGANATELIGEILAMKHSEGTMNELASMVHAHPAISEAIGENANALLNKPFICKSSFLKLCYGLTFY